MTPASRQPSPGGPWAHFGAALAAAHQAMHAAYRAYRRSPADPALKAAWEEAAAQFHHLLTAYPHGFWRALDALQAGDSSGLPELLAFLEADPWTIRSGYAKSHALKAITRAALPPEAVARLQQIVLDAVDGRDLRESRWYCRLARRVIDPAFVAALEDRAAGDDSGAARRARWVLDAIAKHGPLLP